MNFFSEDVRRNPFPFYEQMLSRCPVYHEPSADLWMLFDYQSVLRALSDAQTFNSDLMASIGRPTPQWMIFADPPRHTKLRALVSRAFTPKVVANLEPRIRELSRALLDQAIDRGTMDLATDFSIPLPIQVIAEMIGIPASDWPLFKRWSDIILTLSFTVSRGEEAKPVSSEYPAMMAEMKAYLPELINTRRNAPTDDLLTGLIEAEVDGERLSPDEILAFVQLLLVAGNETTTNLINNTILCLIDNPDQQARLAAAPELLPSAIEEVLRYRSPVQWIFRGTSRDVEMHGQVIPAGKLVLTMIGAANRDPRQFSEPARFDITRNPNPHIAFGHGIHFCIGAPLSRLEARIALSDFLPRVEDLQLSSSDPWEPRHALNVHGPARLPIVFKPRRAPVLS